MLLRQKSVDLVAVERPPRPASKHKPRQGLNDISVLSKVCYGHSLTLGKAVIWRIIAFLLGWQPWLAARRGNLEPTYRNAPAGIVVVHDANLSRDAPDRRQQNRRNVPPVE